MAVCLYTHVCRYVMYCLHLLSTQSELNSLFVTGGDEIFFKLHGKSKTNKTVFSFSFCICSLSLMLFNTRFCVQLFRINIQFTLKS